MTSLPRRAVRDLKVLVSSPVAIALALCSLAPPCRRSRFSREMPHPPASPNQRPAEAAAQATQTPELTATQRSEFERYYTGQPRLPLVVPAEGAKVLVVKFNDYQCPPCRATYMEYKGIFAKYEVVAAWRGAPGAEGFPARVRVQPSITTDLHAAACEAAVAVRLARERGRAEPLEQWIFDNQSRLTPQLIREGARDVGQVTNFDARYQTTLEAVKADIDYGRRAGGHCDADLLHQRRQDFRRSSARLFRPGHRL